MSTTTRPMTQPMRLGPIAAALAGVALLAAAGISVSQGAFNGIGAKPVAAPVVVSTFDRGSRDDAVQVQTPSTFDRGGRTPTQPAESTPKHLRFE